MSLFKTESPDTLKDYKQIHDYILRVNKATQNVFNSLDPDDNFTEEELNRYNEIAKNIAMLEVNVDGFRTYYTSEKTKTESSISQQKNQISLKVKSGDVVNQLNLEKDDFHISGNRLEIITDNFIVTDSKMFAKGNITATGGSFGGWSISSGSWDGNSKSLIDVNSIEADSGSAGTVKAYGEVELNATVKGNFDAVIFNDATLSGGFTCSCMQQTGNNAISCTNFYAYTTYREAGETVPGKATNPDEAPYEGSSKSDYNTNSDPQGGLITDEVQCTDCYSKLAGNTWSDRRLKENVLEIGKGKAVDLLLLLKPSEFCFIGSDDKQTGFIAQETPDEYRTELKNGYYGLKYQSISAVLDRAMKTQTITLRKALLEAENGRT